MLPLQQFLGCSLGRLHWNLWCVPCCLGWHFMSWCFACHSLSSLVYAYVALVIVIWYLRPLSLSYNVNDSLLRVQSQLGAPIKFWAIDTGKLGLVILLGHDSHRLPVPSIIIGFILTKILMPFGLMTFTQLLIIVIGPTAQTTSTFSSSVTLSKTSVTKPLCPIEYLSVAISTSVLASRILSSQKSLYSFAPIIEMTLLPASFNALAIGWIRLSLHPTNNNDSTKVFYFTWMA